MFKLDIMAPQTTTSEVNKSKYLNDTIQIQSLISYIDRLLNFYEQTRSQIKDDTSNPQQSLILQLMNYTTEFFNRLNDALRGIKNYLLTLHTWSITPKINLSPFGYFHFAPRFSNSLKSFAPTPISLKVL